ncbi:hypothetical protein [Pseudochrobactrum sp. HB0163]|uniref:hypothetical protein n=1 Tax=Pseudochrobactrum sp. HB0163 TaxID=3450708 RepID=UPI003F6E2495
MKITVSGRYFSRILLLAAGIAGFHAAAPAEAFAQQYQRCAAENGICRLPYPTEVIYGAGHRVTSRFINQPAVRCSNSVFGDPARGTAKSCAFVVRREYERYGRYDPYDGYERRPHGRYGRDHDYGRRQWVHCAKEGQYCDFQGRKQVRYGTRSRFVERAFRNGVRCDNRVFGDPDRGVGKNCFVLE